MKKKLLFCLIVMMSALSAMGLSAQVLGDVNNDTYIDFTDALLTAQYSVGLSVSPFVLAAADVEGSISINVLDALVIAQYLTGLITQFPALTGYPIDPKYMVLYLKVIDAATISQ